MGFTVVIPARYASTRLPGKPLLDIGGKTMLQRVYERACESSAERVVIATDDERIADAAQDFGAEALMTSPDHVSGTDRIEEVSRLLELSAAAIVVNVQGDEPMIPARVIDQVAANLAGHPEAGIATLCEPITSGEDVFNPNIVKVVSDARGFALYFSRAPIPWDRDGFTGQETAPPEARRHLGIYAYRRDFLLKFPKMEPTPLEKSERLEQMRAVEHGHKIAVGLVRRAAVGIDTPEDYRAFVHRWRTQRGESRCEKQ